MKLLRISAVATTACVVGNTEAKPQGWGGFRGVNLKTAMGGSNNQGDIPSNRPMPGETHHLPVGGLGRFTGTNDQFDMGRFPESDPKNTAEVLSDSADKDIPDQRPMPGEYHHLPTGGLGRFTGTGDKFDMGRFPEADPNKQAETEEKIDDMAGMVLSEMMKLSQLSADEEDKIRQSILLGKQYGKGGSDDQKQSIQSGDDDEIKGKSSANAQTATSSFRPSLSGQGGFHHSLFQEIMQNNFVKRLPPKQRCDQPINEDEQASVDPFMLGRQIMDEGSAGADELFTFDKTSGKCVPFLAYRDEYTGKYNPKSQNFFIAAKACNRFCKGGKKPSRTPATRPSFGSALRPNLGPIHNFINNERWVANEDKDRFSVFMKSAGGSDGKAQHSSCSDEAKVTGWGRAMIMNWSWVENSDGTGQCEQFVFGGMPMGSNNRYRTERECRNKCDV